VVGVQAVDHRRRGAPIAARLVVGADGRHSTVARLAGAPTTHVAVHTSAFVFGYVAGLDAAGYEWAYRPSGTAGFIPTNEGLTCVFAGHRPTLIGRGGPNVLNTMVERASPDMAARLRAATLASPVRTFTGQPGHLRRPWGPGWALVGDAGSWKDPISAHGLTDALRDAELLARAARTSLDRPGDTLGPFQAYECTRDLLTLPILRASEEIAAMRWDDARISELLLTLKADMDDELATIAALDGVVDQGFRNPLQSGDPIDAAGLFGPRELSTCAGAATGEGAAAGDGVRVRTPAGGTRSPGPRGSAHRSGPSAPAAGAGSGRGGESRSRSRGPQQPGPRARRS
jgi:2-polyprenyl-6-methoxyphenol hydroxylase-like FAD-dependent oxidoreductase